MTTNASGLQGQVLAGRYRLVRRLGIGGMGTVWRADDLTLGSPVAIKLLDPSYAHEESVRARFYQEARAAAQLRSPNVVQILDHGVDGEVPFIAMELLDGEDLAQRLHRVGRLSPADTVRIFADVARAVRKAHEAGIVHRDLKPDNIFLVRDDDHEVAKVLDFGVAKSSITSGAQSMGTQAGALIGTLPYMSPEQARGAAIDHRTDLWALGVIAFECLCGRLPFTADAPGELVLQICSLALPVPSQVAPVPPAFDDWFVLACNRDPNERFATAKAMAEALRSALLQRPDTESAASVTVPSAPPPPPAFSHAPAAPRSPTMSGGSTVDFLPRPRRSASLGALLSFAALLIAAGLFVRWLVVRGDSGAPGQPVVAASPTGVDRPAAPPPAKDPSSGAASDPSVPSPNDASSGAPSSLPSPGGTPAGTPSGARSTKTLPSSRAGDPPSAPGMTAPSTKSPPALLPTTAPTTTGTDRLGI